MKPTLPETHLFLSANSSATVTRKIQSEKLSTTLATTTHGHEAKRWVQDGELQGGCGGCGEGLNGGGEKRDWENIRTVRTCLVSHISTGVHCREMQ